MFPTHIVHRDAGHVAERLGCLIHLFGCSLHVLDHCCARPLGPHCRHEAQELLRAAPERL